MMCMRTNIDLDDELVAEAARYSTATSKKAIIHEALATYVASKREERRRITYRERLARVRSKTDTLTGPVGTHDLVRKDRDTR